MEKRIQVSFSNSPRDSRSKPAATVARFPEGGQPVQLRVLQTVEGFSQVAAQWDELLQSLDPVPLPMTSAWLGAWWRAFGQPKGMEMEFRCVFHGSQLVGIAPFVRFRQVHRGIKVTLLKLAANGHSPFSSVVVSPKLSGADRAAAFGLLTKVAPNEIGLFFKVDRDSALTEYLLDGDSEFAGRVGRKPSIRTPVVKIEQSWDDFYRARPRSLKKSLNHKLNRFKRQGGFTVGMEKLEPTNERLFDDMVTVSARSWKSSINNDLQSNANSRQFLRGLIAALGPSGCMNVWMVRDQGRPVAFELHILFDGLVYPIRADYDDEYKAYSPGSVLEYSALKALFESGTCRQYYTCADDYWYLGNWTSDYKDFCTIEVFGSSAKMRMLYLLEYRIIPRVKRLIRSKARTGASHAPKR